MDSSGHLFIIDGDVMRLACDAWLLPTDEDFSITSSFCSALGMESPNVLRAAADIGWKGRGCMLWRASSSPDEPDLWLGDIGRDGSTPVTHYSGRAVEFVEGAAAQVRSRTGNPGRRPLVALNVIGTGKGGKRQLRGEVLKELVPALIDAAHRERCDVALVAYGDVMYAAAQAARRTCEAALDPWASLPADYRQLGEQLAGRAERGELVLFLGAGVSRNAGIPVWLELLEEVADRLGHSREWFASVQQLDPRDQASLLHDSGPERFRAAVEDVMRRERYSLMHGLLSSLPVKEVVTTNFDDLFEQAASTARREIAVIPGGTVRPGERWVLKLHGTMGKDLVFTRSEYLGAMSTHAALRGLVQAMLLTRYMLFVGYKLADEDFHHLMHEVRFAIGQDKQHELGLVLTPEATSPAQKLWPELKFQSFAGGTESDPVARDINEGARLLMILLDYVGSRAASEVRFIADDSLGDLKGEDELLLAEIVEKLHGLVERAPKDGWQEIRKFLEHFHA